MVQPEGIGPLDLAFRQLKEKLSRLGYFDPRRKKPLPPYPTRIALVTSPTGAAVRDMLQILGRRWPLAQVWVCPVPVQGEGAAPKIAAALDGLNRISGIDVIILGRGGGSLEDLWPFNEECVAQAIHASRIPVVSGIGHETDYTIADMVADKRGATPSEAAEHTVPDWQELDQWLGNQEARLRTLLKRRLDVARTRLESVAQRRLHRLPLERIRNLERRLDDLEERQERVARQRLVLVRQRIDSYAARLETLSPLNVLARGYSLTRTEAAEVVRSSDQVHLGDRLVTTVQYGQILSRVEEVHPMANAAASRLAASAPA
jgi:exodeoxyribonuclease VII large subunit